MFFCSTFHHDDGCVVLGVYENTVLCTCTADTKNYALRVQIETEKVNCQL